MTGMMAAMTVGMMAGLAVGTALGSFFRQDLFTSSLLSMVAGIAAGAATDVKPGTTTVEFTSTKEGRVAFSCGMGMFGGSFIVTA